MKPCLTIVTIYPFFILFFCPSTNATTFQISFSFFFSFTFAFSFTSAFSFCSSFFTLWSCSRCGWCVRGPPVDVDGVSVVPPVDVDGVSVVLPVDVDGVSEVPPPL